jgi:hypothetical protein
MSGKHMNWLSVPSPKEKARHVAGLLQWPTWLGPIWSCIELFVGRSVHGNLGNGLPVMEATTKRQGGGYDGEHDDDAHDLFLYLHMSSW